RDARHLGRDLNRRLKRILAEVHRRGPGVVRPTLERDAEAVQPSNRVDDAKRRAFVEQDAALLNVELDKSIEIIPPGCRVVFRWEPRRGHRLSNTDALFIA